MRGPGPTDGNARLFVPQRVTDGTLRKSWGNRRLRVLQVSLNDAASSGTPLSR
jgi:hypothetical protein